MSKQTPADSKKRPAGSLMDYFGKSSAAAAASPVAAKATAASPSKAAKKARVAEDGRAAAAAAAEEIDDPFAFAGDDDEAAPAPVAAAAAAPTPKRSSSGGSSSIKSKHASSSSSAAAAAASPAAPKKSAVAPVRMEISDDDDDEDDAPAPKKAAAAPAAAAASSSSKPKSAPPAAAAAAASRPASSAAAAAKPSSSSSAAAATPSPSKAAAAAAATAAAAAESAKQRVAQAAAEAERKKREQERKRESAASSSATAAAASIPVPAAAAAASSSPSKKSAAMPRKPKAASASAKKANDGSALAKKVSKDVDVVLAPVMRLKAEMAREDARGVKALTLADLNLPNVKTDVKNLNATEVRAQIERAAIECINSIMAGNGFHYDIPARTSANQMYVAVLDRIVLKDKTAAREFVSLKNGHKSAITTRILQLIYELCLKKIHVTKRDLFYTDVKLFGKQTATDEVIEDVAAMIGSTRSSLNVVASEKGVVVGQIQFKDDGDFIDCTRMGVGGKAIPPSIDRVTEITGLAKFVLLVEKDAAFMRLAEDRFYNQFPCIIITAKGQPDVATRLFLKKVKETLRIPVLGLFDADPYGLKILSVYMSGSKNMSYDSASLTTPDIKWLGIRPSDLDRYSIPDQCRLSMSDHDIKTGKELLEEDFIKKNPEWMTELEMMVRSKEKAEIQALSTFGFQFLSQVYLPLKLQRQNTQERGKQAES